MSRYLLTGSVSYAYIGTASLANGKPLTSNMAEGALFRVVNGLLAVHVMVAYVIEGNVLARGLIRTLRWDSAASGLTASDRRYWFAVTTAIVVGAFVLSNAVPFFSDLMGLMGAMCSILLTYTIPIGAARVLLPMSELERKLTSVAIPFSIIVAVFGTISSIAAIAAKMGKDSQDSLVECGESR